MSRDRVLRVAVAVDVLCVLLGIVFAVWVLHPGGFWWWVNLAGIPISVVVLALDIRRVRREATQS